MTRLTIKGLHDRIGIKPDVPGYGKVFGAKSKAALFAKLSNLNAAPLTLADMTAAAVRLGVPVATIKGVTKVETPRGPFDDQARPTILYERHKFRNNTEPKGKFNASNPAISGPAYGPGGYGSYDGQYDKFAAACALDPEAAFRACSWGAFQVLGENAEALGYLSAANMVFGLTIGVGAHLETFCRFVEVNHLVDELRACKPGDPASCRPFVSVYNGPGFELYHYPDKLAEAIKA